MRHHVAERDGSRHRLERGIQAIRGNRRDKADAHVPGVELFRLVEIAEPREEREDRRHFPRVALDPRAGAFRESPREVALPPATGEVSDRVNLRRVAQRSELREVRAMDREERGAERLSTELLAR